MTPDNAGWYNIAVRLKYCTTIDSDLLGVVYAWSATLDRIDTMFVRWFPQRVAVGKLLFHTLSIDHHGGESP